MIIILAAVVVAVLIMASTLKSDARQVESQPRQEALYVPPVAPVTYNQWARLNGVQQDPTRPDYLP